MQQRRILICPLDWGLGHATRCVPVIRSLLSHNAVVIVAAENRARKLLAKEFPSLQFADVPNYSITYSKYIPLSIQMLVAAPRILSRIRAERKAIDDIVREYHIDTIISDNRYGCYHSSTRNIFISHQLCIRAGFLQGLVFRLQQSFIAKFDTVWIPDYEEGAGLAAELSHPQKFAIPLRFIGPLSRLTQLQEEIKYEVTAVISGPEPDRSHFEATVLNALKRSGKKCLLLQGIPERNELVTDGNIEIVAHLDAAAMSKAFAESALIIARSGYSTIMDLAATGRPAILIPRRGQTEQEYLAKIAAGKNYARSCKQNENAVLKMLQDEDLTTRFPGNENTALQQAVAELMLS